MTTDLPSLALEGISKRFGPVVALRDASLRLEPGHVHALLGENGAGKTTLMHVAFGMVKPDTGTVHVHGRAERMTSPSDAIRLSIGMVHQHFTLVPAMSVAENLALGGTGLLRARTMADTVRDIADRTGFALDPAARVESLSVGAQQRVEIAKALAHHARILILDEPTAVLAPAEAGQLLRWLRRFADAGNAVVLITHKLDEALGVADRVTVLRHGSVTYSGPAARTSASELTWRMIGRESRELHDDGAARRAPAANAVFKARAISVRDERGTTRLRDASLVVHGGEIVGVAGVEGAGQHELLRALAGRLDIASGTLERPARVGFVPADRHRDAVLLDRSLIENVALRGAGGRRGRMPWHALRAHTQGLMVDFEVRAPSAAAAMRSLSGGNQQKLVLAREMGKPDTGELDTGELDTGEADTGEPDTGGLAASWAASPAVALVVENPTRGLDVRATAEVHARLRAARDRGAAIVFYSSDLDEVLDVATRMVVVHAGQVREVPMDRAVVGSAMLGSAVPGAT